MNLFNEDNFLHQFFLFLGKLIALNLLWMISSIPIITIGASTTALFYCTLKLHKDRDISAWKFFWKSFRNNFRQSTAIWVLLLVAAVLLWLEQIAIGTMPQGAKQVFTYVLTAAGVALILMALYIFPQLLPLKIRLESFSAMPYILYSKSLDMPLQLLQSPASPCILPLWTQSFFLYICLCG